MNSIEYNKYFKMDKLISNDKKCICAIYEYYELNCDNTSSFNYNECLANYKIINSIFCQKFFNSVKKN